MCSGCRSRGNGRGSRPAQSTGGAISCGRRFGSRGAARSCRGSSTFHAWKKTRHAPSTGEKDAEKITKHLPEYARDPFHFSLLYGIRKGQLAATERRFVDLDREVIEWPAAVCKAREAHTLPLEGEGLVIVKRALADARPWCRYLFHGRDCAPGRVRPRSTRYDCLGTLRLAFQKACKTP